MLELRHKYLLLKRISMTTIELLLVNVELTIDQVKKQFEILNAISQLAERKTRSTTISVNHLVPPLCWSFNVLKVFPSTRCF